MKAWDSYFLSTSVEILVITNPSHPVWNDCLALGVGEEPLFQQKSGTEAS